MQKDLIIKKFTFLGILIKTLILKKGYRFSNDELNYTTPLYLTKKCVELLWTYGLTQLIEEPNRTTDSTSTLLDHTCQHTF